MQEKTTLLKLMTGLYKPSNGSIVYYGNEARMTTVWQEPSFLSDHSKENVHFGEEYLENQLEKNIELVNVKSFIRDLSEGVETVLHKAVKSFREGKETSCIITCHCFKSESYYDEPTAGLDPSNQEVVWNMIEGLGRGLREL